MTSVSTARHRVVSGHGILFRDLHKKCDFCKKYNGHSYAFLTE